MEGTVATQSQTVKPGEPDPSLAFFTEDKPKLKSVFDNVRNYAICATLFGVSAWFKRGAYYEIVPGASRSYFSEMFMPSTFLIAGIILTLLNAVQTYVLMGPVISRLADLLEDLEKKATGEKQKTAPWLATSIAEAIGLALCFTVLFMIIALIRVSYFSLSLSHR
jgi:hypothetical protein